MNLRGAARASTVDAQSPSYVREEFRSRTTVMSSVESTPRSADMEAGPDVDESVHLVCDIGLTPTTDALIGGHRDEQ